jgi:hypothetical protein
MKHLKTYETFFSIFPDTRYADELAVNIAISEALRKLGKSNGCEVHQDDFGGWDIVQGTDRYNYKLLTFNKLEQIAEIQVKHGSLFVNKITVDSPDLKKAIIDDAKNKCSK